MSIIHDALKKVQTNLSSQNDAPPPSPGQPPAFLKPDEHLPENSTPSARQPAPSHPPKRIFSSRFLWLSVILALLPIAVIAGSRIFSENRTTQIRKAPSHPEESPNILVIKPAPPSPAPSILRDTRIPAIPTPPRDEIVLAGIVNIDGKNMALINNEYYAEGETVGGVKLVAITDSSVDVLLPDGKIKTLKLRHR